MRLLTLTEFKSSEPIALSVEQRDSLNELVPSIVIQPAHGLNDSYVLTPQSIIGAVVIDDLAIAVRPKIPIDRVLFLISYSLDPDNWLSSEFAFKEDASIVEAIVLSFTAQLRRAFRRGLLQGYRPEEDSLTTVRGRIRFHEQLRRHFGNAPP